MSNMWSRTQRDERAARGSIAPGLVLSPAGILLATLAILGLVLTLPLSVPIGPMYWDLVLYFDAANRIFTGQIPVVDFFIPVGPLGYYLFAGAVAAFGNAQPLLLVSWSMLAITAPLIAMTVIHVDGRSRALVLWLLLPFLFFAVLPFNTTDYYPYPGSDGFGIYNRQVTQLLFCLTAGLVFIRNARLLALLVFIVMLALFLTKITGFLAGGLLCLFAFATGRLPLRHAAAAAIAFLGMLAIVEIGWGLTSAYLADIATLVAMNSDGLAARLLQAASQNFGVCLPAGLLVVLLLWRDRATLRAGVAPVLRRGTPLGARIAATGLFLDHCAFWLFTGLTAGLFFESQNTGSQAMIFLWPVILAILLDAGSATSRRMFLALWVLALAVALPPAIHTAERAARAYVGAIARNIPLEHEHLKTLGRVNMRPEIARRAEIVRDIYRKHRETFEDFAARGQMPSFLVFSDFDFQVNWLQTTDAAVDAILTYEAANDIRFETVLLMDFANPFPWLLDRRGVRHVAIGADPYRAVPPATAEVEAAVAAADLALRPTCPVQAANTLLMEFYRPMLTDHRRVALTPCFDAYIRNGLAATD